MAGQVQPLGLRPLMFKRSVNYVKIAVHQEAALDGTVYTVLFLGTGKFCWFQIEPIRTPLNRIELSIARRVPQENSLELLLLEAQEVLKVL